jgi:hypothetical protein
MSPWFVRAILPKLPADVSEASGPCFRDCRLRFSRLPTDASEAAGPAWPVATSQPIAGIVARCATRADVAATWVSRRGTQMDLWDAATESHCNAVAHPLLNRFYYPNQ